jgi:hypothetical protein
MSSGEENEFSVFVVELEISDEFLGRPERSIQKCGNHGFGLRVLAKPPGRGFDYFLV